MALIETTLLDSFHNSARGEFIASDVVACGNEKWTYGDLDVISSGLAIQFKNKLGLRPVIAVVSENHPYILATLIATWKLGGIVAPLDHRAPDELMKQMITNIKPDAVIAPTTDYRIQSLVEDLKLESLLFAPQETTITILRQLFLNHAAELPSPSYPNPSADDYAVYIYTSSASSASNLRCVPLSHRNIMLSSQARLVWWKKTWPDKTFSNLSVLGWSPWSHIIGLTHDIGAATFLTAGCYVFGLIPSTYHAENDSAGEGYDGDVSSRLLEAAIQKQPSIFASVPWVIEGFRSRWSSETNITKRNMIENVLRNLKVLGAGGARTGQGCIEWAKDLGLPLTLDLGMTELGALFHATCNEPSGFSVDDCMIADAELLLMDENGQPCSHGELYVRSNSIAKGYLNYETSSFHLEESGRVTLRTGDIYERTVEGRLLWKGRREDFIQMSSGESLDPREVESALDQHLIVARSCVMGNKFLRGPAQFVCAIIELQTDISPNTVASEVTKMLAAVNRTLSPPLRISWSRVLILDRGQHIPVTKKRAVFRKKIEDMFGADLAVQFARSPQIPEYPQSVSTQGRTKEEVDTLISNIISSILHIPLEVLEDSSQSTFAELGMDSNMATMIVNNLNSVFRMKLPLNTCHTYIDLLSLSHAICAELGLVDQASEQTPHGLHRVASDQDEVVIVGQALRLPGGIDTSEKLWRALEERRKDVFTDIPAERWDHASFYRSPGTTSPSRPCDITFNKAGFIDIAHFDNAFFGISSAEALSIVPSVRLTLETAFEALENANISLSQIKGTNMGIYIAAGVDEGYNKLLFLDKGYGAYSRFYGTGVAISTACGRLSYLLDVHGPSITVDTACSSSLVALDQAVQFLQSGQGESAIVCGVNTHTWPGTFGFLSAQKMTSINSRCATFTTEADGYGASEGAVAVILKSKKAALRDGDTILAAIKATDVRHDGRSQGLVAPNVKAQIEMQHILLAKASLSAAEIDFIETHGTGTTLGDLMETQAINEVFKGSHTQDRPLLLTASKTCVGHTEIAAGLVGVLAALASISHVSVPGLTHLTIDNINPAIDCSAIPMHIPRETISLQQGKKSTDGPLRVLVLANGFAGTNAGVILESPKPSNCLHPSRPNTPCPSLFVVSAKTPVALKQYIQNYLDFCRRSPPTSFHSICYTSCVSREQYRCRFACVATGIQDLIYQLEDFLVSNSSVMANPKVPRLLLAFPGQGSQFQGMARDLSIGYSGFHLILIEASSQASSLTGYPILSLLVDEVSQENINIDQSQIAQICLFVYQYSICRWLETLNIHPQAVLGHSLGEIAASVIGGAFTFEFGLNFVIRRAQLLRADPSLPAGMAAIGATEESIMHYINFLGLQNLVVIAVFNGVRSHVVSGELKAVETLMTCVKADGIQATKLNVDQGFHSPCVSAALPSLGNWLDSNQSNIGHLKMPFFSAASGCEIPKNHTLDSQYWVQHARNPVHFIRAATEAINADSFDMIMDIGPQPTIWTALQKPEFSRKVVIATSGRKNKSQEPFFLKALASLFESGLSLNLKALYSQRPIKHTTTYIPTYPYQRQRHYPSYIASRNLDPLENLRPGNEIQPSFTTRVPDFVVDQSLCDMLDEHRIEGRPVLPGAALVDFFAKIGPIRNVKNIRFHQPLVLETPASQVHGEVEQNGHFTLFQNGSQGQKICSGVLSLKPGDVPRPSISKTSRLRYLTHEDVYKCFNNVQFGIPFRNIQHIEIYENHADAKIHVEASDYPAQDRIRKLDSCLHMFGAIALKEVPQVAEMEGAFLPTSLEDFTLHTNDLPYDFVCRYHLPVEIGRNRQVLSVSFDVLSPNGVLLVSCKRYSVAFIPAGVVIQDSDGVQIQSRPWLTSTWIECPLPFSVDIAQRFEELLYLGYGPEPQLLSPLSGMALKTAFLELPSHGDSNLVLQDQELLEVQAAALNDSIVGENLSVIVDVTGISDLHPGQGRFKTVCHLILAFMKLIMNRKVRISNFLVISSMSAPVYLLDNQETVCEPKHTALPAIGAVVQGMLRVFRRETNLGNVWGLDLPEFGDLTDPSLQDAIMAEMHIRQKGFVKDNIVAYRMREGGQPPLRLVPVMQYTDYPKTSVASGTTVIVGMGSIGSALASALLADGKSNVVFLGRRSAADSSVIEELKVFHKSNHRVAYIQADASDIDILRAALENIRLRLGAIDNIIHTAAVVNDAAINQVSMSAYDAVLRPKVFGAWNLHIVSKQMKLSLRSFVMLSSIQVVLGNPGQVAYVSANAFMDTLATHRHSSGLPGTSLQLGAWESKLIEGVDLSKAFDLLMYHSEGIPLILQAMKMPVPVQVIAKWNVARLLSTPAYAKDPFFGHILPSTPNDSQLVKPKINKSNVSGLVTGVLRSVLELRPNEELDMAESLTSCGIDSISFAQIRGRILKEVNVDIPMIFLSETFSINDMVANILENF